MAANAGLTGLSRKHGVKVGAGSVLSVEEVALAVGQKIVSPQAGLVRAAWPRTRRRRSPPLPRPWRLRPRGPFRRLSAEGSSAAPDGATAESQMEEKRDECVRESEVSGESEIVEMVVEMNGESGESGGKVDLTGESNWVRQERLETGETGDRIQTGEQGTVGQVMGGLDGPGIVAGERGEGEVSTGERGEGEVSTGERGEGAVSTGEQGEGAVSTGERGEGGVSTGERGEGGVSTGERGEEGVSAGEGTSGASEWWLVPARRRNKRKSAMKDKGGKTGRLEETVADTDTSDCESMSDGSELSGTTPDGQDFDLYPPGLFKKFLTQTKGMKGLDLGTYFPDRLCFIRQGRKKRALVFDTAKRKRIDVLFLQETHSDCGIEADWEKEWEGQVLLSHNTTLSGGVGLLFSRGFTPSSLEVEHVTATMQSLIQLRNIV
ncbi:hypothetical protein D4764_10G0012130 [Takifugu flavidus]|uniref:Uncharacterized protein n=1 Tax=Takifugu flavidus TaxID=433684 RepID=A0A5C6PLC3_9TELE|nr:hypothetical protein D4764_10G0012130 [Takifugu flavidus]